MRVYANCYELMSEVFREVWEMGHIVHPNSMQNKDVTGDDNYTTKEIINYSYALTNLFKVDYLFFAENKARVWADAEFQERVSSTYVNPGKAWEQRKHIWAEFLNEKGRFDYSYNNRMFLSLNATIKELIRNLDSRQAIINVWDAQIDPTNLGGKKRIPCSMYYQILVRNNTVNIIYSQRSADVVTHLGNDIYLAYKLMEYVANEIGVKTGYLFHNIGSLHTYKKDWHILKQCIEDIKI